MKITVTVSVGELLDKITILEIKSKYTYNEYVIKQAEDIVKGVTSYMNSESYYDSHWNEFIKYTQQLDSIRNENLLDVEPKFKDYING